MTQHLTKKPPMKVMRRKARRRAAIAAACTALAGPTFVNASAEVDAAAFITVGWW